MTTARLFTSLAAALLAFAPQAAFAQTTASPPTEQLDPEQTQPLDPAAATSQNDESPLVGAGERDVDAVKDTANGGYTPLGPEWIKGQPTPGGFTFQEQHSEDGKYALWMHDAILMPVITVISLFVLALLLWVIVKYNKKANPTPSRTTHNTAIEVIWTVVPALILLLIAVPSIRLLASQYEPAPADAITVKATGYQWYWTYTFPDNGDFEVISNMMPEDEATAKGFPAQLEADNRLVLPVGVPIRLQTTAADVIHSFAVPSLWFKLDAVPGRLNERLLTIEEPGIYYGQCSELCGARHAYMPIAVEALPRAQWERWVLAQGGTVGSAAPVDATSLDEAQTDAAREQAGEGEASATDNEAAAPAAASSAT